MFSGHSEVAGGETETECGPGTLLLLEYKDIWGFTITHYLNGYVWSGSLSGCFPSHIAGNMFIQDEYLLKWVPWKSKA